MIFKLANPLRFQKFAGKFQSIFLHLSLMFLVCGLFFSFFNSPPDYLQGETVRIMYIHVPCAWFSLMIYSLIAICSLFSIVFKHTLADIISRASARLELLSLSPHLLQVLFGVNQLGELGGFGMLD